MSAGPTITRLEQTLERIAARDPEQVAVVCGKASMSYGDLDKASTALAARLQAAGVGPGERVALYAAKGIPPVVGLFAALKVGAAYVPLDPTGPLTRALKIVRQCGITVMVAALPQLRKLAASQELLDGCGLERVLVVCEKDLDPVEGAAPLADVVAQEGFNMPAALRDAAPELTPVDKSTDHTAYILYTSGSTGDPKGVTISHRTSLFFVRWAVKETGLTRADRCSNHAPFFFDLSVFDLFATTMAGATVVIVPPAYSAFPRSLAAYIEQQRITTWYSVPSTLIDLMRDGDLGAKDLSALRTVIFAGEVFPLPSLRQLFDLLPGRRLHNWYGPTETNVCTAYELTGRPDEAATEIPIGRVCQGLDGVLLAEDGQLVEGQGEGELLIAGPAVMTGYFGMDEATAAVTADLGQLGTFYRTGDIVRRDGDGKLWYVGRRDAMVKVRGYRIELGEVEAALALVPGVKEGAAVSVPDEQGNKMLLAYVVVEPDAATSEVVLTALQERLPHYMIPSEVRLLERLPRTPNGKVDRVFLASLQAPQR